MTQKEINERLVAVYNALNNVEVKGQNNICNMAASIQILNEILSSLATLEQKNE